MNQEIIKWLPLVVVMVAGFFALAQIKSNNITNARIKWLENLKQVLTDFISESSSFQLKEGVSIGIAKNNPNKEISAFAQSFLNKITESTIEHLKTIACKHDLIKLNLNPKEILHQKLEIFLDEYIEMFNRIPSQNNINDYHVLIRKMSAHSETIILLARYIMKLEWEKTKRSYFSGIFYMKFGKGKKILCDAINLKLLPIKEYKRT